MNITISGTPKEIAALVLAVQERQEVDLYSSRPPMDIRLLYDGGLGGGGSGQQSNLCCFVRIEDFGSAIKALTDIKSSLERISSLIKNGNISFSVESK